MNWFRFAQDKGLTETSKESPVSGTVNVFVSVSRPIT